MNKSEEPRISTNKANKAEEVTVGRQFDESCCDVNLDILVLSLGPAVTHQHCRWPRQTRVGGVCCCGSVLLWVCAAGVLLWMCAVVGVGHVLRECCCGCVLLWVCAV